jgi:hypothetical protein
MAADVKKEIQLEIAHVLFIDIVGGGVMHGVVLKWNEKK